MCNLDKLKILIDKLRQEEGVFIVEGINDKKTLIHLGIASSRIIEVSHKPIHTIRQELMPHSPYIHDFLDEDKEGEKIRKRIEQAGIHLRHEMRRRLFSELRVLRTEEIPKALREVF